MADDFPTERMLMDMEMRQGVFAVKLCELEEEYGRLQSRIQICQEKDSAQLRQTMAQILDEYKERDLLLKQRVKGCCMRSVANLAQVQLDYQKRTEDLLRTELRAEMSGKNHTIEEDRAEASTLFAEYAIDFATQAMRYALYASMRALVLQAKAEEMEECGRQAARE